ncbi:hypothetical protein HMPREF1982_04667 [Clostridiales bacterium oral taxon 876 str. F0540]|nr:hypothetical protein HMPREF1982_04667 [Clostridiales bacterium oral taxon 876 str. F0540]
MKKFKKVGVWIILSIFLQAGVLFYLDRFYFVTESNVDIKKVEEPAKPAVAKKEIDISIPETAKNINISSDGKYVAYYEDGTLHVVNTITGDKKKVEFDEGKKFSYYMWLPDVNNMLIAEKKSTSKQSSIVFSNYDAEKDKKKDIANDNKGNATFINLPDKQSDVDDIEMSRLTGVIYIKISNKNVKNSRSSFYEMNRMAQISSLKVNSNSVGSINTFSHQARLAYEDLTYHKVYATGVNKPIVIKGVTNTCLIGTDDEDKLYIGAVENNKVKKIYYGLVKDSMDTWRSIELKNAADKKDIFVSTSGDIYVNDNLKGSITNIMSNKEVTYKGKLIEMYENGAISLIDGKLYKVSFDSKE